MKTEAKKAGKIIPLESMRGIAAFIVFLFHFMLGFVPQRHGQELKTAIVGGNLKETPFFFFINGHAAVVFFFVLSGFVLSYRFFSTRDTNGLIRSVLKRWPRLFPLALISTLLSCFLIHNKLYRFIKVSKITHSYWMSKFGLAAKGYMSASYLDAFNQGFFYTFFRGDENLNTNLWTMQHEFLGSLLVFAIIPLLNNAKGLKVFLLFLLLMFVGYFTNIFMWAFIFGCFLSHYRCQIREKGVFVKNKFLLFGGIIFSFLALGYQDPGTGFYSFMNYFGDSYATPIRIFLQSVGSLLIIDIALNVDKIYKLLDCKIGRFLGRCSFALYIFHVPLMFSFSAFVFLYFIKIYSYTTSVLFTFVLTLPILFLLSWGMSILDEYWCRFINVQSKKIT